MSKPRHGNKEAKKPKQTPAPPAVPTGTTPTVAAAPNSHTRKR